MRKNPVGAIFSRVGAISRSRFLNMVPKAISRSHLLLILTTTTLPLLATADARTTADGVYTQAQAQTGLDVHEKHCAKCHHHSYYQGAFLLSWHNQPVASLYDLIKMKMPEDRPGSLRPREYAALIAYVFALNQLPAGEEPLDHGHAQMQSILITNP